MSHTADAASAADPLRAARVALRTAMYDAALELLHGCEGWPAALAEEAVVLKAETMARRDPVAALGYLTMVEDLVSSPAGRFNLALQFGKAHSAVRAFSPAESRYTDARRLASRVADGAATMAYHDMRMRWFRRECDANAPEVVLAVAHPDPSIASAAYAIRAWFHATNERYDLHVADLRRAVAFATLPAREPVDVAALATSVHALAQVAFETADGDAIADARRAADALAWTADVRTHHFATTRVLGWDAFMRGRAAQAQWAFSDARRLAPTAAWRVLSHADRAYVARMSGNEFWAAEELAKADALAGDVAWATAYGEARQLLVVLAVLHARTDAPRAQRYAALYAQIGTESADPTLALDRDVRAIAHAKYAQGRIDQTLGRDEAAIASLREAYEIFDRASFHYRATLCAGALAELTGSAHWRDASIRHANAYPDCPLATFAERSDRRRDAMPGALSPLQRQIAGALFAGADTDELSHRFSRSRYTIERHVEAVFASFGVTSHTALLDEARRRKLA